MIKNYPQRIGGTPGIPASFWSHCFPAFPCSIFIFSPFFFLLLFCFLLKFLFHLAFRVCVSLLGKTRYPSKTVVFQMTFNGSVFYGWDVFIETSKSKTNKWRGPPLNLIEVTFHVTVSNRISLFHSSDACKQRLSADLDPCSYPYRCISSCPDILSHFSRPPS